MCLKLPKAAASCLQFLSASWIVAAAALCFWTSSAAAAAEFRVNTFTAGDQAAPGIARLDGGNFVVVWDSADQDGSSFGVYARRYRPAGTPIGGPFRVNRTAANSQLRPSIAALSGGGFVVVWESIEQDSDLGGIYAQRFNAAGTKLGPEFRVNTRRLDNQSRPKVARLTNGFVTVWQSTNQDTSGNGVYGQRFTTAGAKAGGEFRVNTVTTGDQQRPAVAGLSGGGFAVAWHLFQSSGPVSDIYGKRYASTGQPQGQEFRVNTSTADAQEQPAIAGLSTGGFVVAWESDSGTGGIFGQRYAATGARAGGQFRVNTAGSGPHTAPVIAGLAAGEFVAAWESFGQDGSGPGVYGQRFSAGGAKSGPEFRINQTISGNQTLPALAGQTGRDFIGAWTSDGQDGSGDAVYGRLF